MKLIFVFILSLTSMTAMGDDEGSGGSNCGYSLSTPALSYNVIDVNPRTSYSLSLTRGNQGSASCNNFIMGFSKGGANSYNRHATNSINGSSISYNLYQTSATATTLSAIIDATSSTQLLSGTISKNSSRTLNYFFQIGTLSSTFLTRAGTYADTITIEVDSGTHSSLNGLDTSKSLAISIIVPKMASLSLVDTGSSFDSASTSKTLDFGELTASEAMSFDIILISNAGYNLSVSSANNQVMQLTGGTQNRMAQIGYNFYANAALKNLSASSSSPVSLASASGVTSTQGTTIPIRIVIQAVDNKIAGTYQDYLTFTIATTE